LKLYTIGFSGKTAQQFFEILKMNKIDCLLDIRIYPSNDDAGFCNQVDLPYFLEEIANCAYKYCPELAPTEQLLDDYHLDPDWQKYVKLFALLMEERKIPFSLDREFFEARKCCLLCFEPTAEFCHRRLVSERIQDQWTDVEVIHL
jgi:uncharacterized protein (DUF488 family)